MARRTFRHAICAQYGLAPEAYVGFVLDRVLYWRVRALRPILLFFFPEFLFNEVRLIEKVAGARTLQQVQEEIDYYHHKYVAGFLWKDVFRFRIAGARLMKLAAQAFSGEAASPAKGAVPVPVQDSFNP